MKHRKHLKCWKRVILMFYEKVGTGQQKAGKVKKKQLEEKAASNQVNWQEVRNMSGYKKSFSEMKSTNRQAISQHDKFLHIKLPKPLDILSSTVQNITNKFRKSEGISVHRAPQCYLRSLFWAFRQHKLDSFVEITARAQERCKNVLSVKKEREHWASYQTSAGKSVSLIVWGCLNVIGSLHMWEGKSQCWKTYAGFGASCPDVFFRKGSAYFSKTMPNCFYYDSVSL